jgi:hypothetical protein
LFTWHDFSDIHPLVIILSSLLLVSISIKWKTEGDDASMPSSRQLLLTESQSTSLSSLRWQFLLRWQTFPRCQPTGCHPCSTQLVVAAFPHRFYMASSWRHPTDFNSRSGSRSAGSHSWEFVAAYQAVGPRGPCLVICRLWLEGGCLCIHWQNERLRTEVASPHVW